MLRPVQTERAVRLGVSRSHLCDLEKGRKSVSPARAAAFAAIPGYSEKQFVRLVQLHCWLRRAIPQGCHWVGGVPVTLMSLALGGVVGGGWASRGGVPWMAERIGIGSVSVRWLLYRQPLSHVSDNGGTKGCCKDKVGLQKILDELPEDASLEDIQFHIYVRQRIQQGWTMWMPVASFLRKTPRAVWQNGSPSNLSRYLLPLYHPGRLGRINRPAERQMEDIQALLQLQVPVQAPK